MQPRGPSGTPDFRLWIGANPAHLAGPMGKFFEVCAQAQPPGAAPLTAVSGTRVNARSRRRAKENRPGHQPAAVSIPDDVRLFSQSPVFAQGLQVGEACLGGAGSWLVTVAPSGEEEGGCPSLGSSPPGKQAPEEGGEIGSVSALLSCGFVPKPKGMGMSKGF